jgi:hypothetical protein
MATFAVPKRKMLQLSPVNQWYLEPAEGYIYWLTDKEEMQPIFPVENSQNLLRRGILKSDTFITQVMGPSHSGAMGKYWMVVPLDVPTALSYSMEDVAKAWPSSPDFENLDALMKKFTSSSQLALGNNAVLIRNIQKPSEGQSSMYLSVNGHNYLKWWENYIQFLLNPAEHMNPEATINIFKKYAGKDFSFEQRDDLWGVIFRKEWLPIFDKLYISLSGTEVLNIGASRHLQRENRQKGIIKRYIDSITAQTVLKNVGTWQPEDSIVFRCVGCMNFDSTHVRMHILRGDLTLYMIYSAFKEFGTGVLTPDIWLDKFVNSVRRLEGDSPELGVLKKAMDLWLKDCILQRNYFLRTYNPPGQFASGWRGHVWKHSTKGDNPELPHFSTSSYSAHPIYSSPQFSVSLGIGGGHIDAPLENTNPQPVILPPTEEQLNNIFAAEPPFESDDYTHYNEDDDDN